MNTMCQTLLACARLALDKNVVIAAGDTGSLMLQSQEFTGLTYHAVQAVARTVTGCMCNSRFQILDRHRQNQGTFDIIAGFNR
ncbi:hypothetical protein SDC9_209240 [bioreactor metagenome]|uniref:Uncharacterized protein n=1 Tax=bioreactor metagenome TaxID=1076179 RepID=A0A645JE91_9ZZZZ